MSKHDHCCSHDHQHDLKNNSVSISSGHNQILGQSLTSTFQVSGMDCADEIQAIQKSLLHPQIGTVIANLMTSQVVVTHAPELSKTDLISKINATGVTVIDTSQNTAHFWIIHRQRVALVVSSAFFLICGFICEYSQISFSFVFSLYTLSTLAGLAIVLPKAWRSVKQKILDMNILMVLAVVGAYYIKDYAEAATVVCLFAVAELLEAYSVSKARKAIKDILSIDTKMAFIEKDDQILSVPVEQVYLNQTVIVYAGSQIPVDGIIIDGSTAVNQAALTGESNLVEKNIGDTVLAGTINESGTLKIKVLKPYSESKISHVIRLIEDAQSKKAPAQLFVDKFAKIYTPIVTLVALFTAILPPLLFNADSTIWLYKALVFLVIACPCALVIATPIAIVSSLTALARIGVLVKGGIHLEELGRLKALALDKTGTLTHGKPQIITDYTVDTTTASHFYNVIYAIESQSSHPLAKAAVQYVESKMTQKKLIDNFKMIPGKGVEAIIDDNLYLIGNQALFNLYGQLPNEIQNQVDIAVNTSQSILIVGNYKKDKNSMAILGFLGFADSCKHNAVQFVQDIRLKTSIQDRLYILSGDHQKAVTTVAKTVGIQNALGHMLPVDKVNAIKELISKYHHVGMVGDGTNDAPALATANVGIAMGAIGTDAAIETADIALMSDDLNQLKRAIVHAQLSLRTIQINIGFALLTKLIFLILGLWGYSSLWLAVAADMGATLIVIAHSMRLLKIEQ